MRFVDDPLQVLVYGTAKLWILLVGVNQYEDERLTSLNFAISDCQGLADVLEEATQRFPEKEVINHYNSATETSTLQAIRTSLQRIISEAKSQDTVLFYFSGHGLVEPVSKQPFLCLKETQTDSLHDTGLGLQELLQQLKLCGGKQLILLDACHSGSIAHVWGGARGEARTQLNPAREMAEVLQQCAAQSRGFCALLSCDEGQRSWEFPALEHGVFTYYLIQGLQGKATNEKGVIEADKLSKYVSDQTQQYVLSNVEQLRPLAPHNCQQTPRRIVSAAEDIVIGWSPRNAFHRDYDNLLEEYMKVFNSEICRQYPLSQDTRQQLQQLQQERRLRDEDVRLAELRSTTVYEENLKCYEQEVNNSIHQEYPLSQGTCQKLQQSQQKLELSNNVADSIQARVIEAYEKKLQEFEQKITTLIHQEYPLNQDTCQQLQASLGLREEITEVIVTQVSSFYEQKIQQYEIALIESIHQEYPIRDAWRNLQELQQRLELNNEIIEPIVVKVTFSYEQKIQEYEKAFTKTIQRQYPLSNEDREFLENLRRALNLSENQGTRVYEQKVQQYAEEFDLVIHQQDTRSDEACKQLQQLQQNSRLRKETIDVIEAQVTQGYEQKIQQYAEEFDVVIHQQNPLGEEDRKQLQQLQQSLRLRKEIIDSIEAKVTYSYQEKVRRYKEAFTKATHQHYPYTLNQDTCQQLQRLQQELKLSNSIVAKIEEPIILQIEAERQRNSHLYEEGFTNAIHQQPLSACKLEVSRNFGRFLNLNEEIIQSIEKRVTQAYEQKLQQYEEKYTRAIHQQHPLSNEARSRLQRLQGDLKLRDEITESIEAKVTSSYEQKLRQYEEAFNWCRQHQYPLSVKHCEFLEHLRRDLNLSMETTNSIQEKCNKPDKWGLLCKAVVGVALVGIIVLAYLYIQSRTNTNRVQDRISFGEKALITAKAQPAKQAGVEAIKVGDYNKAIKNLEASLQENKNDPESRIFLNNIRIGKQKSYTIAVSVPIGPDPNSSLEILRGVAQAQTEINSSGGVKGVPLKVAIANDGEDREIAKQIASALAKNPDVLGVVGHFSSDITLAAGGIYNSKKLVAISPVSTSVKLSSFSPYVFRTVPSDRVAARALANYMGTKLQQKNAAVFFNSQSGYSKSLKSEFVTAVSQAGGKVSSELDLSNSSFSAAQSVKQAIAQGAKVLMLAADTNTLDKALQVVQVNDKQLNLLGGDAVYTLKTLEVGGDLAAGMVVAVAWDIEGDPMSAFPHKSRQLWGADVNWRTALAYDATRAFIAAMQRAPTRNGIQNALREESFSTTGASGTIQFFPSSGDRNAPVQLVKIVLASPSGSGYDFVPVDSGHPKSGDATDGVRR